TAEGHHVGDRDWPRDLGALGEIGKATRPLDGAEARNFVSVETNRPFIRPPLPREETHEGAFSRTVGSDNGHELARRKAELRIHEPIVERKPLGYQFSHGGPSRGAVRSTGRWARRRAPRPPRGAVPYQSGAGGRACPRR